MQPVDQSAILKGGMGLVPDYAAQRTNEILQQLKKQELGIRQQQVGLELVKARREIAREEGFERDMMLFMANPTANGLGAIYAKYPKFGKEAKGAWEALDDHRKKSDLSQLGSAAALAAKGNYAKAAEFLEARLSADRAAGEPEDAADTEIVEGLKSADPLRQKQALGLLAVAIGAAVGPEHAKSYLESQGLDQGPDLMAVGPGVDVIDQKNPGAGAVYSSDYKPETWTDPASGVVYRIEPAKGGDPSSPTPVPETQAGTGAAPVADAADVVKGLYPTATITEWRRDPKSKLGRANPGSYHNSTGAAVDTPPIEGLSFNQYVKSFRDRGFAIIEARDEVKNPSRHATGPHWHVVLGIHQAKSKQQYDRLPKGARYQAPDGSVRTKS